MILEYFGKSKRATRDKIRWFVEQLGPISYRTGCFWLYKNDKPYFEIPHFAPGIKAFNNLILKMQKDGQIKIIAKPDPAGEQTIRSYVLPVTSKNFKETHFYHHEDMCNAVIIALEKAGVDCQDWQRFGRKNSPKIETSDGPIYHAPDRYGLVDGKHCYFELELTRKTEERTRRTFDWYRAALKQKVLKEPATVIFVQKDEKDRDWLSAYAAEQRVPDNVYFTTLPEILADPTVSKIYRPAA